MPSIFSHAVVPLAAGLGLGLPLISRRLLVAGVAASMVPDLDVLVLHAGVPYEHAFGHRGASHSFVAACLFGLAAMLFSALLHSTRITAFVFVAFSAASHGLLDMLTNGGGGVALFWPFSNERPAWTGYQVIQVSPLSVRRFFGPAGVEVLKSELLWIWLPALCFAGAARIILLANCQRKPRVRSNQSR